MFFYLSKILPVFVYPIGLVCFLGLAGLFLSRYPRGQKGVWLTAVTLLWLASSRVGMVALVRPLETYVTAPQPIPQAEVIVVLGGSTRAHLSPRPMVDLNEAGDRLIYAAWLYQQGVAPRVLLSGGNVTWLSRGATDSEASEMAELLPLMGVPASALWLEDQSRNTYENAVNGRTLLDKAGIHRLVLVTSALHMPRAKALFEAQGFEVIPAPTDFMVTDREMAQWREGGIPLFLFNLTPTADNLALTTHALKEYLGLLVYWLSGWL